jgi:hypothetical protein
MEGTEMPSQDQTRPTASDQDAHAVKGTNRPALSRRSLLQGAATAGIAATAIGVVAAPALAATKAPAAGSGTRQTAQTADTPDSIVLHVRDARTGDIEVFSGTTQTRLRDRDLAARIAKALR